MSSIGICSTISTTVRISFVLAAGTPGLVMQVFTLPSFPYVFKVIRDQFPPQKEVTHKLIKERYLQVKKHDRIGRMADTLDFAEVALPLDRIEPKLLQELHNTIAINSKSTMTNW